MKLRPAFPVPSPARRRHLAWLVWCCWLVVLNLAAWRAEAHSASTAWLTLSHTHHAVTGQWEIALRDLDAMLGLDANDDGELVWGELKQRHADIAAYALDHLSLKAGGQRLALVVTAQLVSERADTPCAVLQFAGQLPPGSRELTVDYRLLFAQDPLHRGLASLGGTACVLSPDAPVRQFPLNGTGASGATFVREGMRHIWTGYDHLAFLFALLLPAVLRRTADGWRPAPDFRSVLVAVLKVVTAFTLAHSLTLALAALEIVRLPTRPVEATIAASILIAVALNFRGRAINAERPENSLWLPWRDLLSGPRVAFLFGLIHGFGFAGVLGELGLRRDQLAWPLLGFNAGVELGQLACVLVFLPVAFLLRATRAYRLGALPIGSAAIALLAGGWLIERTFDLGFMPF